MASFIWNVRTLGPVWWLRCALQNVLVATWRLIPGARPRGTCDGCEFFSHETMSGDGVCRYSGEERHGTESCRRWLARAGD